MPKSEDEFTTADTATLKKPSFSESARPPSATDDDPTATLRKLVVPSTDEQAP
jgi:hypothetical protein